MKASTKLTVRDMVTFALLACLTFSMKVVMSGLPNIEPVSLMVMLMMVVYGWRGLYGVYVYVALEILFYGLGIWNAYYLYVWMILAVPARLLRRMEGSLGWALLSGVFGLSFGGLCAMTDIFIYGPAFALTKWINGIVFDIPHCIGNFVIALVLFTPLRKLLVQLKNR